MACTRLNPFDGPVKIYVRDVETGNDAPVDGSTVSWTGWTDLGYRYQSSEGTSLELSNTNEVVRPMGFTGGIMKLVTAEDATVSVAIKKTDFESIAKYLIPGGTYTAGATPILPSTLTVGGARCLTAFELGLEGYDTTGGKVVAWFPRVTASDSATLQFRKGDTEAPYVFSALADESADEGEQIMSMWQIPLTYTLTYTSGDINGTITGTTSQTVIAGGSGTEVTAVAGESYEFVEWSDGVLTAARTDANVSANIAVTATFEATGG